MLSLFIFVIGGIVSALMSLGFVLTFAVIALGLLGPLVMPMLFGDRDSGPFDSGPFDSAGGAMAA